MDENNHYIRIDANNIVISAFSDAFQSATPTDILIESNAGRHFNPNLINEIGQYIYKWNGSQMVERSQEEQYPLSYYQQQKINEIQQAASIDLGTFQSPAISSTPLTYLSGVTDMLLIEAEDRFMQGTDYDGQPVLWYTIEQGDIEHTKDQIHKVYLDGRSAVQTTKYKAKDLVAQVKAVVIDETTTYEEAIAKVRAVTWT